MAEPTDIAPDRRNIDSSLGEDHRVHELVETPECRPNHVVAGTRVPSLQVPWKGNENNDKTKEGDDRIGRPSRIDGHRDKGVQTERKGAEGTRQQHSENIF